MFVEKKKLSEVEMARRALEAPLKRETKGWVFASDATSGRG